MKVANRIIAGFLIAFLFTSLGINLILKDSVYSESEKRELQQFPEFNLETVISAGFMGKFDKYVGDQFYGRDSWVNIKGLSQFLLGQRKLNGVYITDHGYIRELIINEDRLETNIDSILRLAEKSEIPITLMIVPEASTIYEDELPYGAESREQYVVDKVVKKLGDKVNVVYPKEILSSHKDEYVYFKGDHHWTMVGANYAYNFYSEKSGFRKFATVSKDFKGTMLTKAGVKLPWIPYDEIQVPEDISNDDFTVLIDRGNGYEEGKMFYHEFLDEFDKYRFFTGGDQPLIKINSKGEGSALVIKDSFANVMLPYLALDREETYVVDTRYNRQGPAGFAKDMAVDEIILIYSPDSLCNEASLINLKN